MATTTTTAAPTFVWDENYDTEQVRPYFEDYMAVRDEMIANGERGYYLNDSFRGRIPGIAGSEREDTGIYLLQVLRSQTEKQAYIDAFVAAGGERLLDVLTEGRVVRGSLAMEGWYMNGTGWEVREDHRVTLLDGRVYFKAPRQRAWRSPQVSAERYLIRVNA